MDQPMFMSDPTDYQSSSLDQSVAILHPRRSKTEIVSQFHQPSELSSSPPMSTALGNSNDNERVPPMSLSSMSDVSRSRMETDDTDMSTASAPVAYGSNSALSTPVSKRSVNFSSTPATTPYRSAERSREEAHASEIEFSSPDQEDCGKIQTGASDFTEQNTEIESRRSENTAQDDSMVIIVDEKPHPSACIFVASLSSSHTLEDLKVAVSTVFTKWNPVDITVHRDSSDRPYAFVQLRSFEDARDALESRRGVIILDRPIRCEFARVNRSVFLASSKRIIDNDEAEAIFSKYGQLELLIVANVPYGRGILSGWCAKFEYREDAINAYFDLRIEKDLIIFYVQNPDPNIPASAENPAISIRNLDPKQVTVEMLENKFRPYGRVMDVQLLSRTSSTDPNEPLSAFVRFENIDEARRAIVEENKTLFLGRRIYLSYDNHLAVPTMVRLAPAPKYSESSMSWPEQDAASERDSNDAYGNDNAANAFASRYHDPRARRVISSPTFKGANGVRRNSNGYSQEKQLQQKQMRGRKAVLGDFTESFNNEASPQSYDDMDQSQHYMDGSVLYGNSYYPPVVGNRMVGPEYYQMQHPMFMMPPMQAPVHSQAEPPNYPAYMDNNGAPMPYPYMPYQMPYPYYPPQQQHTDVNGAMNTAAKANEGGYTDNASAPAPPSGMAMIPPYDYNGQMLYAMPYQMPHPYMYANMVQPMAGEGEATN
ncbi:hypothetical protein BZA70DRAFT_271566 [Myxozyma melibiosi]|uniref:RRM domain-containing protein n=1 Tax=Myxozyma melibiosi TaxID=54550 RepID=A0ABR1FCH8_9ASCO